MDTCHDGRDRRFRTVLLPALAVIVLLAACSSTRAVINAHRGPAYDLPVVKRMVVALDMARLFRDHQVRRAIADDGTSAARRDTLYLPVSLGERLEARLADHGTDAACAYLGFTASGPASVDSLARAVHADAVMWVRCPLYGGEYDPTVASLLGFGPTAFGETPALHVEELDLDLAIPTVARPDRDAWTGYMQIERGAGDVAVFADSIAAVIVRQLAADGVIGAAAGLSR